MRLLHCFFYFLLFYIQIMPAVEYIYPVASLGNGTTILYIHQYCSTKIELFKWDTKTNHTEQILWSIFNPAGLQLLPDNSGFSFIDNGRLRIKLFQRRSPKAIDFDDPLFNINALHWIDEHSCYCSAQSTDNFALFELYDDGTMQCLVEEKGKDYMYPQKVGEQLFYIERCAAEDASDALHYHIIRSSYPNNNLCLTATELIADFDNTPIIFLTMLSDTEGFVVEHAQSIDSDSLTTHFSYHQIIKEGDVWCKNLLFSFTIPCNLLLNDKQRLYESILPLLPRVTNNKVYFVNCDKNTNLEPYFFDLLTKITQKITVAVKRGHYFVPMLCGQKFYCGGTKLPSKKQPLISFLT